MMKYLRIAEKNQARLGHLALLRWSLVIVFLWFGGEKFTDYAAHGIAPLIEHSPIVGWLHVFGVQGESRIVGTIELLTALTLAMGAFNPVASVVGGVMGCGTFLLTMSFFLSTPGVAEASAGGFPVISTLPGQFLLKDVVLFAASLCLVIGSISLPSARVMPR